MSDEGRQLADACRAGVFGNLLEEYLAHCRQKRREQAERKKGEEPMLFPNVAGFCRYFHIGESDLAELEKQYPWAVERLHCVLEDEALNSHLSPTLLSVYLKRRLGYDKTKGESVEEGGEQMQILFEHDAYEDGG